MTVDSGPEQQADHSYVFTIGGRCLRCQKTEVEHPVWMAAADPMTGCSVDHRTVNARMLIGDGGWVRSRCPGCRVMIEPIAASGEVTGPKYGPGRGDLTPRAKIHLRAWLGWHLFNGGDDAVTIE